MKLMMAQVTGQDLVLDYGKQIATHRAEVQKTRR